MMTGTTFEHLAEEKTVVLTTFRRDGTAVPTPINILVDGDRAYFRTWHTTGKAKRMRNNPQVTVAPSTFRGKPTGEPVQAQARLLDDGDPRVRWARRMLPRKNRVMQPLVPTFHRLKGVRTQYYELTADPV